MSRCYFKCYPRFVLFLFVFFKCRTSSNCVNMQVQSAASPLRLTPRDPSIQAPKVLFTSVDHFDLSPAASSAARFGWRSLSTPAYAPFTISDCFFLSADEPSTHCDVSVCALTSRSAQLAHDFSPSPSTHSPLADERNLALC